ncbi:RluA family pseudouridine synthase [uncultured Helcococcus sp.]|uniref:RluA family pseudouridine synthase n=1 Tax=uncultured Helcococcus sp. TaxID=1072508 RepID=UPI002624C7EB|nr:RluA family pseudouridine synthase [uncultured Helcococcus sp.]
MANINKILVSSDDNERLDSYLADYFEDISRSKISEQIKKKTIKVNETSVKPSYLIKEDDLITIDMDAFKLEEILPEDLKLEIIYQDDDIALINKPKGIVTHPTNKIRSNTLVNYLLYKFDNLPTLNGTDRPGIVHRLDMDTSGLLVVALNEEAMQKLKDQFKSREIIKKYRTLVNGSFDHENGTIERPIGRSKTNRKLMEVTEGGKYALTSYEVVESNGEYSLLDIDLHTGRTHQIRVHLASINRPILGDKDYNKIKSKFNISGQLLQAYHLEFNHPITGENLTFEIDPDPEFEKYYNIIFKGE